MTLKLLTTIVKRLDRKLAGTGPLVSRIFRKLKRNLPPPPPPRNVEVSSSLTDATEDQITDSINIRREYHNEFQHRLRKREIKSGLEDYERLQNMLYAKYGQVESCQ